MALEKLKNMVEALERNKSSSQQPDHDDFDLQVLLSNPPRLGLKLIRSERFMTELATNLKAERKKQQRSSSMDQRMSEKLKAASFPISSISIGSWTRVSGNILAELTAKIYYAKRKLVWEIFNGNLKNKMEISWSDIIAIKAVILPHQPSTLEIELSNPPQFFLERAPQPRKHTLWERSSDFTSGQALLFRRHTVTFPPGKLDKPYEDLLRCDQNLLNLSMMPFPKHQSPRFYAVPPSPQVSNINEEQTIVFKNQPQLHYAIASTSSPPPLSLPLTHPHPYPPTTTQDLGFVNFPHMDETAARSLSMNSQASMWENHQATGLLSNARVSGSPAEERQLPPYHHHFCCQPEEYGCDLDFVAPLYPECNPIPHRNTSYGMNAADHEQVVMMQNDSMFPPPPPPPHIEGAGCSHGAIPGLGDEGLAQILYFNHGAKSNDDHVQAQVKPPQ